MAFINCTLIVQIINFFIAFFIIKYFFFKPILASLHAEDAFQNTLINKIQTHRAMVAQKEQELSVQWQSVQRYFEQNSPSLKQRPSFPFRSPIIMPSFDSHTITDAAHKVVSQLVKKVEHAR